MVVYPALFLLSLSLVFLLSSCVFLFHTSTVLGQPESYLRIVWPLLPPSPPPLPLPTPPSPTQLPLPLPPPPPLSPLPPPRVFLFLEGLMYIFLVACTQLYKSLCRSVCRSVRRSVTHLDFCNFLTFFTSFHKFSQVFISFHKFSQVILSFSNFKHFL